MPDEFAAFCHATHRWLSEASTLDPSLAAALDLLRGRSHNSDAQKALAEHTLYALWKACATGELEHA